MSIYRILSPTLFLRMIFPVLGVIFLLNCRSRQWDISELKITGIAPKCENGRLALNASLSVTFNKKIDRASAQILVYSGNTPVTGTLSFDETSVTFKPSVNFDANTEYTWVVPTSVRDENGDALSEMSQQICRTEDGVDTVPPVTTPGLAEGVFSTAQSVVLTCADNFSGCDKIIYTTNGSIPTLTNGSVTSGNSTAAIPLGMGDNVVRYTAVDKAGNIAPYYEARYSVSATGYLVVGTASHFARGIGARPNHFEAFHSGMDQDHVVRDPVTQLLYVATGDGLFISNTNGATYTYRPIGGSSVFADRQKIFIAGIGGIYISSDGGNTFTLADESAGLFHDGVSSIAIHGNRVYAVSGVYYVAQSKYVGGLAISTNGGSSFTIKTTVHGLASDGVFKIFADGARLYMTTAVGLTISPDGGNTFLNRTTANGLGSNQINAIYASGMDVYAATSAGLSISHDGGNTFVNRTTAHGLPANSLSAIYGFNNKVYAAFTDGSGSMYSSVGVGVSSDGGLTFQNYGTAQGHLALAVSSIFADQSAVYASTRLGLMKSTNLGQSYTHDLNHLGHQQVENGVAVSGNHLYAGTLYGVSYSQNGGSAFQTLHKAQGLDYANIGYVQDVKIAGGKVFVALTNGLAVAPVGVHNFQVKTTADGLAHNYITKLYADGNTLYALSSKINKTTDGGSSFSAINLPSSSGPMNFWASGNEILIITENEGIFRSIDGGANWTTFDDSNGWIFSMNGSYVPWGIFKEGNKIYYGTEQGLFVSNDNGGYFDLATGYSIFANSIRNILVRDGIIYLGAYNSNIPDPMAPYENILNWSTDRIIYGTSPNQEQELGGMAVYGIERYLNPNGDG